MKGQNVLKHPNSQEITQMLKDGYTPKEIAIWIKQKQKHVMYHLSAITLQNYRANFLELEKADIAKRRVELLSTGTKRGVASLDSFSSSEGFIEANQKATAEIINAIENFKSIQDKILERINIVERDTVDAEGKPIYKARNEEILQGYLGRLESMTNSFVKLQETLAKKNNVSQGTTEISITMNEMNKYTEMFKLIMQKTITRIDASLLNDFYAVYNEEKEKMMVESGLMDPSKVNISINNGTNKVSIVTTTQEPAPRQEYIDVEETQPII